VGAETGNAEERAEVAQYLQQIAAAVNLHFWLLNVDPIELVYASPATERAWDSPVADTHPLATRVHPEDLAAYADLFAAVSGGAREAEYRVLAGDGSERWRRSRVFPVRDANGSVFRIAGVTEDITAHKQAEQELVVHRALERLITGVSVEFVNLPAARVDDAFHAALAEFAQVIGADYAGIALVDQSDDRLRIRWQWRRSEDGTDVRPVESLQPEVATSSELLRKNGLQSVMDAPLLSHGKLLGVLAFGAIEDGKLWPSELPRLTRIAADMFANAIERLRRDSAIRSHRDQLAHVLRLGTMGQLASGIAHELNQPLAAILNYANACQRRLADGRVEVDLLRSSLQKIGAQAQRAGDVIMTLRALVRAGGARRDYHDLNALIREALSLLEAESTEKNIRIQLSEAQHLPKLQVDGIQVQQVVLNLACNAMDAIAAAAPHERSIHIETRVVGSYVEVSMSDTGPGVEPGRVETIFEDFHTTKEHGLGLGLSISRSLVEAHGGRICLDADVEAGACFRFTLPIAAA